MVGGVPTFVVGAGSKRVLVCTDIFGWELPNIRNLARAFAAGGDFTVFIPDLCSGDAIKPDSFDRATFPAWRSRHGDEQTIPIAEAVVADLRNSEGPLFTIGFCWGARWSVLLAQNASKVDGFAIAHPSFVTTADIEKTAVPGIFLLAETDAAFPPEAVAAVRAMPRKDFEFRGPYTGTVHGFAGRGSDDDAAVVAARADATASAIAFLAGIGV